MSEQNVPEKCKGCFIHNRGDYCSLKHTGWLCIADMERRDKHKAPQVKKESS
jgi:hypothetical protein